MYWISTFTIYQVPTKVWMVQLIKFLISPGQYSNLLNSTLSILLVHYHVSIYNNNGRLTLKCVLPTLTNHYEDLIPVGIHHYESVPGRPVLPFTSGCQATQLCVLVMMWPGICEITKKPTHYHQEKKEKKWSICSTTELSVCVNIMDLLNTFIFYGKKCMHLYVHK